VFFLLIVIYVGEKRRKSKNMQKKFHNNFGLFIFLIQNLLGKSHYSFMVFFCLYMSITFMSNMNQQSYLIEKEKVPSKNFESENQRQNDKKDKYTNYCRFRLLIATSVFNIDLYEER
jgi:hypothetical protein